MRLPLTMRQLVRRASAAGLARVLVFIEFSPMADFIHDNPFALDPKADAIIPGAQPIPTSQVARKSLDAAYLGPMCQPLSDTVHACPYRTRQSVELLGGLRG